jgi:hypothetical protein
MPDIKYEMVKKLVMLFKSASGRAKFNVMRELQSESGEELSALVPSVLERTFKGEL